MPKDELWIGQVFPEKHKTFVWFYDNEFEVLVETFHHTCQFSFFRVVHKATPNSRTMYLHPIRIFPI